MSRRGQTKGSITRETRHAGPRAERERRYRARRQGRHLVPLPVDSRGYANLPCSLRVARHGCTLRERCSHNCVVATAHREYVACSLERRRLPARVDRHWSPPRTGCRCCCHCRRYRRRRRRRRTRTAPPGVLTPDDDPRYSRIPFRYHKSTPSGRPYRTSRHDANGQVGISRH